MKTLLIPIDFSETAKDAFKYAIRLAQHINANLKVVNVYHEDMLNTYTTLAMMMTQTVEMGRFLREDLKKIYVDGVYPSSPIFGKDIPREFDKRYGVGKQIADAGFTSGG
jgi:nucleotide-binding universal stress UspA family protein